MLLTAVTAAGQQDWTLIADGAAYDPSSNTPAAFATGVDVDSNGNVVFVGAFDLWRKMGTTQITSQAVMATSVAAIDLRDSCWWSVFASSGIGGKTVSASHTDQLLSARTVRQRRDPGHLRSHHRQCHRAQDRVRQRHRQRPSNPQRCRVNLGDHLAYRHVPGTIGSLPWAPGRCLPAQRLRSCSSLIDVPSGCNTGPSAISHCKDAPLLCLSG